MRLGVEAALVDGVIVPGDVVVDDGRVAEVGARPAGRHGLAVPGFVDVQVNGFGGVDFLGADTAGYRTAGEALLATGVTAYLPTIITAPRAAMVDAVRAVASARAAASGPRILGVHVEGPFLNPRWKGAHDEAHLRLPDPAFADQLCDAGPVRMMTIAPELPGGMELIGTLVERDVVVSLGHTDADARTAHQAYDRGASALTHVFNAQRRFTARDPGVSAVSLLRSDVTVGLIADLVHLAPESVLLAWHLARGRAALVTDAIAAAPAATGSFTLGGRTIVVDRDSARLPDGTLAGSVLTMDRAVRNLTQLGVPLVEALAGASTVPARLLRQSELGTLRPGHPADIVVLDGSHQVQRTLVGGRQH
jgi:N-acetylglucosamine-6-phosphate deacetylase